MIETEDVDDLLAELRRPSYLDVHLVYKRCADTIERLREENARYREAHEKIIELKLAGDSISRAALNQQ